MVQVASSGRWVVITAQRGASDDSEVYLRPASPKRAARRRDDGGQRMETRSALYRLRRCARISLEEADAAAVLPNDQRCAAGTNRLDRSAESRTRPARGRGGVRRSAVARRHGACADSLPHYLHNASDRLRVFAAERRCGRRNSAAGDRIDRHARREPDDGMKSDSCLLPLLSRHRPSEIFRLKPEATLLEFAQPCGSGFRLQPQDSYQTSQVWYSSRDGTKISMFLVHRDGPAA